MCRVIQVPFQVRVHYIGVPGVDQVMDVTHRFQRFPPPTIRVLLRLHVGLEDRVEHQHRRRLHHAVTDRRNPQRSFSTVRFGRVRPQDGVGSVLLLPEILRQFAEPPFAPIGLDVLEALTVHAGNPAVGTALGVGVGQHVFAVQLVVKRVETIVRRSLRFRVQRRLQFPNFQGRL